MHHDAFDAPTAALQNLITLSVFFFIYFPLKCFFLTITDIAMQLLASKGGYLPKESIRIQHKI